MKQMKIKPFQDIGSKFFYYDLCSSNGTVMLSSGSYNSKQATDNAIDSVMDHGLDAKVFPWSEK